MLNRITVQKSIDKLPAEFSIDELIEQLIFVEKVEVGLNQSREGNVISHEDVKTIIDKWSK
jgi:predicted transcriptional regulator